MIEMGATTHGSLETALVAFQADMPSVHKGQRATIPGKDGRSGYSYRYADLADVAAVAHPLLTKHGLSFTTQPRYVDGAGFVLVGVLRHQGGQRDEGMLPIMGRDAQAIGSSITYARRYLLGCMTGIVTDDDEDGAAATSQQNARPQAMQPTIPSRDVMLAKLDEVCMKMGKTRDEVTGVWLRRVGLDSLNAVPDVLLFDYVRTLRAEAGL